METNPKWPRIRNQFSHTSFKISRLIRMMICIRSHLDSHSAPESKNIGLLTAIPLVIKKIKQIL